MPIIHSDDSLPSWCELEFYEIVRLPAGASHRFARRSVREKLIVGEGECRIAWGGQVVSAVRGANLDLTSDGEFSVQDVADDAVLIRMGGRWGEEVGGSGLFSVVNTEQPHDGGDPVPYPKQTNFDCHYHDCDEYWILYEGGGTVVTEGIACEVGTGDCVTTGMGHHHDFPQVTSPVRAVYFETTLEGAKRLGHLWDHTHGMAQPRQERIY